MSIQLGKAIYAILSGDTTVKSYVQNKIYPIFAPDETLVPFIVYERKNVNAFYTKDGLSYDECVIVINIVSANYTECISIADASRKALELKVGVFNGISIYQVLLSNVSEDYGVDGFITSLEFTLRCI
jgi:hypothetical protein